MPSPITTSQFPLGYRDARLYEGSFMQGAAAHTPLWQRLGHTPRRFRTGGDGKPEQYQRWRSMAGTARPTLVAEGADVPSTSPVARYERILTARKLANRISLTLEAGKFSGSNGAGEADALSAALAQGLGFVRDLDDRYCQVFRGAHATQTLDFANFNCWDGQPLCSASHPLVTGTASNTGTAALSQDALRDAIKACMEFKDDMGNLQPMHPRFLVVPAKLKDMAVRLTESANIAQITRALTANPGDPTRATDDAPNAINPLAQEGLSVIVVPEIGAVSTDTSGGKTAGSDVKWYLVDPTGFDMGWRLYLDGMEPENKVFTSENLTEAWIWFHFHSMGVGDWRWIYGSTGAG